MRCLRGGFAACVLMLAGAARAEPRIVTWTSYLRAGPGLQYAETDEIQGGGTVDVLGCASGWCEVLDGGATGYLEADRVPAAAAATAVAPAATAPASPAPVCFEARRTGFRAPMIRYCAQLTGAN